MVGPVLFILYWKLNRGYACQNHATQFIICMGQDSSKPRWSKIRYQNWDELLSLCLGKKFEELFIWICSRGSIATGTHLLHLSPRELYCLLSLQLCKANLTIEAFFPCKLPSLVLLHFGLVEVCCLTIRAHKHGKCPTFAAGAAADGLGNLDSLTPCIRQPRHTVEVDFNLFLRRKLLSRASNWCVRN